MDVMSPQLCMLTLLDFVHFQECMTDKVAKFGCVWLLVACLWGCARNGHITDSASMPEAIPLTVETVVTEVDALLPRAMFVYDGKLGIYKEREDFMLDF